jgi:hypothetical protein
MATYAKHECAGCGLLLPRNELVKWTTTQKTAEIRRFRNAYDTGNAYKRPRSEVYREKIEWMCLSCARPKRQWRTFWRVIWGIVIIFGLIFVAAALL